MVITMAQNMVRETGKVRFLLRHSIPEGMRFYIRGDTKMTTEMKVNRLMDSFADAVETATQERLQRYDRYADMFCNEEIDADELRERNLSANMKAQEAITDAKRFHTWAITTLLNGGQIDGIKVAGYEGTWYVIDVRVIKGQTLLLLEHEKYGDETESLIVTEKTHKLKLDDVWNGWSDYYDTID